MQGKRRLLWQETDAAVQDCTGVNARERDSHRESKRSALALRERQVMEVRLLGQETDAQG